MLHTASAHVSAHVLTHVTYRHMLCVQALHAPSLDGNAAADILHGISSLGVELGTEFKFEFAAGMEARTHGLLRGMEPDALAKVVVAFAR